MNPLLDRLHRSVNRMTETARVVDGSTRMAVSSRRSAAHGARPRRRRDTRWRDLADGARAVILERDLGESPRRVPTAGSEEDPLGAWRLLYGCLHQALVDLVTEPFPSPPCPECTPEGEIRHATTLYRRALTAGTPPPPSGYDCLAAWWFSDAAEIDDGFTVDAIGKFFFTPVEQLREVATRAATLRADLLYSPVAAAA